MIDSEQKGWGKVMHNAFNMEVASPLRWRWLYTLIKLCIHLAQLCGVKFPPEILPGMTACHKVNYCKGFSLQREKAFHSPACRVLLTGGAAIEIVIRFLFTYLFFRQGGSTWTFNRGLLVFALI